MIHLAHLINPVNCSPKSDLFLAQPVTFETLRRAREGATRASVRLLTTQYPEDRAIIPPAFEVTSDLERSVLDLGSFPKPRKLPIFGDLIRKLYEASDGCDYLVYSNVDIAVQRDFYDRVAELAAGGLDAFTVTRRTIRSYTSLEQLEEMYADPGRPHPGHDCFVFRRDLFPKFYLTDACVGATWFDKSLLWNLAAHAERFRAFTELHLTFHIGDDQRWKSPDSRPFSLHNKAEITKVLARLEAQFGPAYDNARLWPVVSNVYEKLGFRRPLLRRGADRVRSTIRGCRRVLARVLKST